MASSDAPVSAPRPRFLNLLQVRLPVTAVASILHRASGLLLFLATPLLIHLLDLSLRGPEGLAQARELLAGLPARLLVVVLAWAFAHHLLVGVRFLLIDVGVGESRPAARRSAFAATAGGVLLAVLAAVVWL
jgi:succinate dehydrogenase / fumarate reductase cytochrome b subunit